MTVAASYFLPFPSLTGTFLKKGGLFSSENTRYQIDGRKVRLDRAQRQVVGTLSANKDRGASTTGQQIG